MVYDSLITEDGRNFGRNMEWERLTKIEVVGHVGVEVGVFDVGC